MVAGGWRLGAGEARSDLRCRGIPGVYLVALESDGIPRQARKVMLIK